jgi:lincosamide nucleotidyltransferase
VALCVRKQEVLISPLERSWLIAGALKQGNSLDRMGSVGVEVDRLDDYSDLDFFGVVEPGFKNELALATTISRGGYKLLFQDGVFCEFAVFEETELRHIPFAPGRIVWKKVTAPDSLALSQPGKIPRSQDLWGIE